MSLVRHPKKLDIAQALALPNGRLVKLDSKHRQVFQNKGITCVNCGLKGRYFVLIKHRANFPRWSLHLYGLNEAGQEILITLDHIYPKVKGGRSTLENLQPMCQPCNSRKGSRIPAGCVEEALDIAKLIHQSTQEHNLALIYSKKHLIKIVNQHLRKFGSPIRLAQ